MSYKNVLDKNIGKYCCVYLLESEHNSEFGSYYLSEKFVNDIKKKLQKYDNKVVTKQIDTYRNISRITQDDEISYIHEQEVFSELSESNIFVIKDIDKVDETFFPNLNNYHLSTTQIWEMYSVGDLSVNIITENSNHFVIIETDISKTTDVTLRKILQMLK